MADTYQHVPTVFSIRGVEREIDVSRALVEINEFLDREPEDKRDDFGTHMKAVCGLIKRDFGLDVTYDEAEAFTMWLNHCSEEQKKRLASWHTSLGPSPASTN